MTLNVPNHFSESVKWLFNLWIVLRSSIYIARFSIFRYNLIFFKNLSFISSCSGNSVLARREHDGSMVRQVAKIPVISLFQNTLFKLVWTRANWRCVLASLILIIQTHLCLSWNLIFWKSHRKTFWSLWTELAEVPIPGPQQLSWLVLIL